MFSQSSTMSSRSKSGAIGPCLSCVERSVQQAPYRAFKSKSLLITYGWKIIRPIFPQQTSISGVLKQEKKSCCNKSYQIIQCADLSTTRPATLAVSDHITRQTVFPALPPPYMTYVLVKRTNLPRWFTQNKGMLSVSKLCTGTVMEAIRLGGLPQTKM